MEKFIIKQYSKDERPIIKGNGFDGLEIGSDRVEAQEFVDWVNKLIPKSDNIKTTYEQYYSGNWWWDEEYDYYLYLWMEYRRITDHLPATSNAYCRDKYKEVFGSLPMDNEKFQRAKYNSLRMIEKERWR